SGAKKSNGKENHDPHAIPAQKVQAWINCRLGELIIIKEYSGSIASLENLLKIKPDDALKEANEL
ncbi:6993_t:CDS:2, partial [Gigaspora rosea]